MGQLTTMVAGEFAPFVVGGIFKPTSFNTAGSLGAFSENTSLFNRFGSQTPRFFEGQGVGGGGNNPFMSPNIQKLLGEGNPPKLLTDGSSASGKTGFVVNENGVIQPVVNGKPRGNPFYVSQSATQIELKPSNPYLDNELNTALNTNAAQNVVKVTTPIDFDGHIFNAEIKPNGNIVGGHSATIGNVQIVSGTATTPNAQGVYQARIRAIDPNTGNPLSSSTKLSTMFPDSWTADRIKVEVDFAFKHKTTFMNNGQLMWKGTTPSGVRVQGYMRPKVTVYPLR